MYNFQPSQEYIDMICAMYGDPYDDRESGPHKSLRGFQRELAEQGINLATGKIRKILITGGKWSTETTRTVGELYEYYTEYVSESKAIDMIASDYDISEAGLCHNLPYRICVYNSVTPSKNAIRCKRHRLKMKQNNRSDK